MCQPCAGRSQAAHCTWSNCSCQALQPSPPVLALSSEAFSLLLTLLCSAWTRDARQNIILNLNFRSATNTFFYSIHISYLRHTYAREIGIAYVKFDFCVCICVCRLLRDLNGALFLLLGGGYSFSLQYSVWPAALVLCIWPRCPLLGNFFPDSQAKLGSLLF